MSSAVASLSRFEELLRKTPFLKEGALEPWLEQWEMSPPAPEDALAELRHAGLLTALQADRILAGKSPEMRLGKYLVVDRLGSGGMGQVFLAHHAQMGRQVALKVLPREQAKDPEAWERFRREAQAAARLDHPNIVHAHDMDEANGLHFLVLEYVDGLTLDCYADARGPLPAIEAAAILRQAALGLQHAHEAGLVHRDIKPANLLLDQRGTVKILDMGIALMVAEANHLTRHPGDPGDVLGTADYLSPEQAMDSHQVDIRADLYSLGATGYFLLTGRPLFPEGSGVQKLLWHQLREPQPLAELRPDLPPAFEAIVTKLLAKNPDERYATPKELAAALLGAFPNLETVVLKPVASASVRSRKDGSTIGGKPAARTAGGAARPAARPQAATQPRSAPTQSRGAALASRQTNAQRDEARPQPRGPEANGAAPTRRFSQPAPRPKKERAANRPASKAPRNRMMEWVAAGAALLIIAGAVFFFTFAKPGDRPRPEATNLVSDVREVRRFNGHAGEIRRLAISPDGKLLLTASHDHTTRLWEVKSGKELAVLRGHEHENYNVAFSPDGLTFLTCGRDGVINHYETESRALLKRIEGHRQAVHMVAFSPDGKDCYSASFDHSVRRWNLASGSEVGSYLKHDKDLRSLSVSPDGKRLLSVGLDQAVLWDTESGQALGSFAGHTDEMRSGVLAPDGEHAISTGRDQVIRVWKLDGGKETRVWRGHRAEVFNIVLHPSGKYAATGSADGTFRIWSVPSGELLYASPAQGTWVAGLAFTPDGKHLAVGGTRTVRLLTLASLLNAKKA